MRHFTIPIFVPELACPNQCVFCNQRKISGALCQPSERDVVETLEEYLTTIPARNEVEIGFFGGNFTGIEPEMQESYLELAQKYVEDGKVGAIRLSTRPDYISRQTLEILRKYSVTTIELGAQSLDKEVLKLAGRGHTVEDVKKASQLILSAGFALGLQMMIGLPGDNLEKSKETAYEIIRLGATNTRIYPTLVIADTELENLYRKGLYEPLSLPEAIAWTKEIVRVFEESDVKILRIGLHPSEGLLNGENLVAGPFHVSFGEMVGSALWKDEFLSRNRGNEWEGERAGGGEGVREQRSEKERWSEGERERGSEGIRKYQGTLIVEVPVGQLNAAVGHKGENKKMLLEQYKNVVFRENPVLRGRQFRFNTEDPAL